MVFVTAARACVQEEWQRRRALQIDQTFLAAVLAMQSLALFAEPGDMASVLHAASSSSEIYRMRRDASNVRVL